MSEPFIGQIQTFGFNFAPRGWALCNGATMNISQYTALFSLLGTTYGGDGRTSFALPDLRGRTPLHKGDTHQLGQKGGAETVTLTAAQIPAHTHTMKASSSDGSSRGMIGKVLASGKMYRDPEAANTTTLRSGTITNAGGGQAHDNMQPYTTLSFAIALQGLFPSRN